MSRTERMMYKKDVVKFQETLDYFNYFSKTAVAAGHKAHG